MANDERRSSERVPSEQSAAFFLENGEQHFCTIADFCSTGMYITFAPKDIRKLEASRIMRVSFKDNEEHELFVNAQPMHVTETSAGLRFVNSYPNVIEFLNRRYSKPVGQSIAREHRRVIEQCLAETDRFTRDIFSGLLVELVDAFRQEAIASSSDQEANRRMATADRFEKAQSSILSKIARQLLSFDSLAPAPAENKQDSNDLSLVEKGAFEDWLLSRVLITKLESNYRTSLLTLKMRCDVMHYRSQMSSSSPLGPERVVYAFRSAVHDWLDDPRLERKAFKLLEKALSTPLDELYDSLNELLASAGVMPELSLGKMASQSRVATSDAKPEPQEESAESEADPAPEPESVAQRSSSQPSPSAGSTAQPSPEASSPANTNSTAGSLGYGGARLNNQAADDRNISALDIEDANAESDASTDVPQGSSPSAPAGAGAFRASPKSLPESQTFTGVGRLLNKLRARGPQDDVSSSLGSDAPVFSSTEVNEGLSRIGDAPRSTEGSSDEQQSLLDRVMTSLELSGVSGKRLDDTQKTRIDVVDRFFGSLQHNPRLSSEGKQHLFRLEIPVLRQLLENEEFFDDQDSPLRDVLNRIAKLGAQGGRLGRVGHQKIEQLVVRINDEYDQNKNVVNEVKAELDELLARQHATYIKNLKRVAAAADGAHKVEEARKLVINLVSSRVKDKQIPKVLDTLIAQGWVEHLNLLLIKHGRDSKEFHEAFSVIDALLAFSSNPESGFDARYFVPLIQEGLKNVSGGQAASKQVRDELKQLILDAPQGRQELVSAKPVPTSEELARKEREQQNLEKSKALKPWIKRAKSVPLNAWLRFQKNDQADLQFMRLVWIAKGFSKFVFVNHQGMKVIELGMFKFAEYLKSGQIAPDPGFNLPIVKQGLDDMVKEVYEKLAFESSHDKDSGLLNEKEFMRSLRASMQKGERTSKCCLIYLRLLEEGLPEDQQVSIADLIGKTLKEFESEDVLAARMDGNDFAMFSCAADTESFVDYAFEKLDQISMQLHADHPGLELQRSEVWGYLGFHNAGSLLGSARSSLQRVEVLDSGAESGPRDSVTLDESASSQDKVFDASDSNAVVIYMQEVKKVSRDEELQDHETLRGKLHGMEDDSFFVPHTRHEAQTFNSWWLGFLARRQDADADRAVYRVPISSVMLIDDSFKEEVIQVLEYTSLNPDQVCFDLYDSIVIDNEHLAADIIRELQVLGFSFCLDEFGSRRCPARLLQVLPVDMIAITADMLHASNEEDESDESLVDVAHHFGRLVVATEVDSAIALQRVERQGVDFIQGERIGSFEKL